MPIRDHKDSLSRTKWLEDEYFKVQDKNVTRMDFNRFLYMQPGVKSKSFDWRLDWDKNTFPSTTFVIDQQKFVNRPDAIAYAVYGNSKYWWIISMVNKIKDPFIEFTLGKKLNIPDLDLVKRAMGI